MPELLAGGAVFMALALIIYAVASQVEERSTVRDSLRAALIGIEPTAREAAWRTLWQWRTAKAVSANRQFQ